MIVRTLFVIFTYFAILVQCQINLENLFKNCSIGSKKFDDCLKDKFNKLQPYFNTGLPDYGLKELDPLFNSELFYKNRNPLMPYKLTLKNLTETGWTTSKFTRAITNLKKNKITVAQTFPIKRLNGWYEFEGNVLGGKINFQGLWNLSLFDYSQTLTFTRKPGRSSSSPKNPIINVKCNLGTCKNLELHVGNLAGENLFVENVLDGIINSAWLPGYIVLRPIVNEIVGGALTEIFDRNFKNFSFEDIFK